MKENTKWERKQERKRKCRAERRKSDHVPACTPGPGVACPEGIYSVESVRVWQGRRVGGGGGGVRIRLVSQLEPIESSLGPNLLQKNSAQSPAHS
jgi:hypothetical protein